MDSSLNENLELSECNVNGLSLNPYAKCFLPLNSDAKCFVLLSPYAKCFVPLNPYAKWFEPKRFDQLSTKYHPALDISLFQQCNKRSSKLNFNAKCLLTKNDCSYAQLKPSSRKFTFQDYFHCLSFIVCVFTFGLFYALFYAKTSTSEEVKSDSPHALLKNLRMKNTNKIIIGHLNINSIRNKFILLADIVKNNIDILLISETKIDESFPRSQFLLKGFSEPLRLDRNSFGGGLLLYVRNDIPAKPLQLISNKIESIFIELNISNKKWLMAGIYNPKKSLTKQFLSSMEDNINHHLSSYENMILFGDFNCEMNVDVMSDFCSIYNLKNLIKMPTCFKNPSKPSCIDLILTNRPNCFQHSCVIESGLSDFHKLTVSVLKSSYRKRPPKVIRYRDYSNYSCINFRNHILSFLDSIDVFYGSNDSYFNIVSEILDFHAPIKLKYVRANDQPFMNSTLRKEHMKRTRLRNKYYMQSLL